MIIIVLLYVAENKLVVVVVLTEPAILPTCMPAEVGSTLAGSKRRKGDELPRN